MTKRERITWLLITCLFAMCIAWLTFPAIVANGGKAVPNLGGDGGKNIFVYLYHILYGTGYWFTGMNYPYGEHIIYTDGQPLLSVLLCNIGHVSIPQALGIMWSGILLSYVLGVVYVSKILQHFGVRPFIAMLFSGLIILLSPQVPRSLGHFGLSYVCVIPMLFYWTIQYNIAARWRYAIYIFVLGLLTTFIHPYFSAVVLVWVGFYTLGYFIFTKAKPVYKLKQLMPLLLSVIALFAVTGIVVSVTDHITDRPIIPYGLTAYCTRGEHIFTSHYSPIWKYLEGHTKFVKDSSEDEGFTYLGMVVIIAFVCSVIKWITARKPKTAISEIPGTKSFQPIWLFIALLSLLLGMGVPFVWHMEWIIMYLSFLKQFRTLGRFSWIFYYVVAIYGAVVTYGYYARHLANGRKLRAYLVLVPALALWGIEAGGYVNAEHAALNNSRQNYDIVCTDSTQGWQQFLMERHYHPADFQAVLLLPLFNVGMDKLWLGGNGTDGEIGAGLATGIQLHLPMVDAMMARSSWGIAEKEVKIEGGPYVYKPALDDMPDHRPLLLLYDSGEALNPDEAYLLTAADSIGRYMGWCVYACYPDRIKANDKKHTDTIKAMLPYVTNDTCIGSTGTWYINHFDTCKAGEKFFGGGAQEQMTAHEAVVANIAVKAGYANQQYEFSCWFLLGRENYRSPYLLLDLLDATGNVINTVTVLTKKSTDNDGLWFRSFAFFAMPDNCISVRCRLFNDPDNTYKIMDEMQLRPAAAIILSKSANGAVMVNNHLRAK